MSSDELEPYRLVGDPPLDSLLDYLDKEGYPLLPGDDLLAQNSKYPPHVQKRVDEFLDSHKKLPSWADTSQLERGQLVFLRYLPAAFTSLYYRSLVAGFSIPKIAAVIQSTAYLAPPSIPEQVAFRLVDTGAFVGSCMQGLDSLIPGGEGWRMCLYVRVLHAKVRRSLLRRTGKRAWNIKEYGIPINQEDMAATLLAFSVNTIVGIEFLRGVDLSRQEKEDYIALWRYIGWLLGVSTIMDEKHANSLRPLDPCGPGWLEANHDSVDHATCMLQSIILHLLKPDSSSVTISHHLLKVGRPIRQKDGTELSKKQIAEQAASKNFWFHFRSLVCRSFIGDPLADALKLPLHPQLLTRFSISVTVRLYLWVLRCITWVAFWDIGRIRLEKYFFRILGNFHAIWTDRHHSRMASALHTDAPCCPFAMITKQ